MQVEVVQSQTSPVLQQLVQPQRVVVLPQMDTQLEPTGSSPQPHLGGVGGGGGGATHFPDWQVWPVGQLPLQIPPQPFAAPQAAPEQFGTQAHLPLLQTCPAGQVPLEQVPPQPSAAPQALPVQSGVQQSQAMPLL